MERFILIERLVRNSTPVIHDELRWAQVYDLPRQGRDRGIVHILQVLPRRQYIRSTIFIAADGRARAVGTLARTLAERFEQVPLRVQLAHLEGVVETTIADIVMFGSTGGARWCRHNRRQEATIVMGTIADMGFEACNSPQRIQR